MSRITSNDLLELTSNKELVSIAVDPNYMTLAEEMSYIKKPVKTGAVINIQHDIPKAKARIKASLKINRKTDFLIVFDGQVIEIGATIKYIEKMTGKEVIYKIEAKDTLYDILVKLEYTFKKESPFIYIIPTHKKINPTFTHYIETLGRNFEGSGNLIAAFGNPAGFDTLLDFHEDVIIPLREQMKLQFDIKSSDITNLLEKFLDSKLESSAVKAIWDKYKSNPNIKNLKSSFDKQARQYFKETFIDQVDKKVRDGSIGFIINTLLEGVILQYLMRGPMNTKHSTVVDLARKFEQFRTEFLSGGFLKLEVFFDLLFSSLGFSQFMQSFLQIFYASSLPSVKMAYNTNPSAFIGEIPEALIMSDIALPAMIEAWAQSDFKDDVTSDIFRIFHTIDYTLHNTLTGANQGDFSPNIIDNQDKLKDIKECDNNDVNIYNDQFPSRQNSFDVLVGVFKSVLVSFESKHLRSSELNLLNTYIHNIAVDQLRTIQSEKYIHIGEYISNSLKEIRKKFEYYTIPISLEQDQDLSIWNEVFSIDDPKLLRHWKSLFDSMGNLKGDVENLFYLEVTKLINKHISEYIQSRSVPVSKSDVKDYVNELLDLIIEFVEVPEFAEFTQFTEEIQSLVINILGRDMNQRFYRNLVQLFRNEINSLLQDTIDGFRLVWYESIRCHLDSGLRFAPNWLSSDIFIVDDRVPSPLSPSQLNDNYFLDQKTPFIWIHRKDINTGKITDGIMKVHLVNNKLPTSQDYIYGEGFYDSNSGEILKGVYVCNEKGNFLLSQVGYLNGEFFVRDSQWFKAANVIKSLREQSEIIIAGKKVEVSKLTYWRADTKVTGKGITAFLQEVVSTIIPINPYEPAFKASIAHLKTSAVDVLQEWQSPLGLFIGPLELEAHNKLDGLLDVTYQLSNAYELYGALSSETTGAGSVSHSFDFAYLFNYETLLQLHKDSRTLPDGTKRFYTEDYFKEVLKSLNPDKNLDLSKISWFFIKDGQIEKPNNLRLKEFYQKFLDLIRARITANDVLFTEFKNKLDNSNNFDTSKNTFTDTEEKLLGDLRSALSTIFGYTGFTLLQMGLMVFNKINNKFEIDFIIPSYKTLVSILNKFQIRPLNTKAKGLADTFFNDILNRQRVFLSILFSGQMQLVVDSVGMTNKLYTYPRLDFIRNIFPNYISSVEDMSYHTEAYQILYNTFYSSFAGRERFGQRIADAKVKLLDILLSDIIDTQIDLNTLSGYSPFTTMSKADQKIWLEFVKIYYRIAISDGLYFPQGRILEGSLDPTATIFDMILGILEPKLMKVLVNGRTEINNKLVQEYELNLGVLLSKLTAQEIREVAPALYFTYDHLFRSGKSGYESMKTEHFWDSIEGPIEHTVYQLFNIFYSEELKDVKKFTIQFRRLSHSGVNSDSQSGSLNSRVYNSKGVDFNEHPEIRYHNIVITEDDLKDLDTIRQKLFSIVYYMVKYQAYIVVKDGLARDGNFIFSAMLHKIFGLEYLKSLTSDGQWKINDVVVSSDVIKNWDSNWNKGREWHDSNMFIPFYLFLDNSHSDDLSALRDLFKIRFGVNVENLIRTS